MAKKNRTGNREPRKPKQQKVKANLDNGVSAALSRQMSGQPKPA